MSKDTERLDFLQRLNKAGSYTGKYILRMSNTGRGWRLHETSEETVTAFSSVRDAIDNFMASGERNE